MSLPDRITSLPVVLRTQRPADAARVLTLAGDWDVARMTALIPHPYLPGMAEEWFAASAEERDRGTAYNYAIARADDGLVVGAIGLRTGDETADALGYWVGRPYWGSGFATAAARALIAVAFARLDIDRIGAMHLARNPASGRVLEKCGMTLAGRKMGPHRGGPPEEFCVWSIRRAAWEEGARTRG